MNARRALAAGLLLVVTACGGSGSGVSRSAAAQLETQVAAIRTAAAHGDRVGSAAQLLQLLATVQHLRAQGRISAGAEARILSAAQTVETDLALLPAPTTTTTTSTTTTSTTSTTTTTEPPRHHDHGHHHDQNQD